MDTYAKGRRAERRVARTLRSRGFSNIRLSKGSRGPADIYAFKKSKR
jgi:Holliday junction resolvase